MNRETNRQLEQVNRQLLSARTARVEEPTHAQSPDCDEGISEVHAGPDDPVMVEVDAMTADEASGSSTDSEHGYDDDDDGILADKVPPRLILPVAWSPPLFLVDETPHKTILGADELYSACESLKSRWQAVDCFVDLKRLGSALVAQNSRPADINDIFGCKRRQQRLLRPLRRSVVLRHATSIARVRENAAYELSHYPHPWSCNGGSSVSCGRFGDQLCYGMRHR
jgi:hypothetical protein